MTKADLRRVERTAKKAMEAELARNAAIVAARESGETLRDIAEAAGISHQRVWQILREGKSRDP